MEKKPFTSKTIDEFISIYPPEVQKILQELRTVIKAAAPEAGEKISYGIPTFTFHGNLVHFSAYKKHIGFYPGGEGVEVFLSELGEYNTAKGTIQFPLEKPIPYDLITRIVKFRVQRNLEKATRTKSKKTEKKLDLTFDGLIAQLGKPAQRALQNAGINSIEKLVRYSSSDLLQLHGIGKTTIPVITQALAENNLTLRNI